MAVVRWQGGSPGTLHERGMMVRSALAACCVLGMAGCMADVGGAYPLVVGGGTTHSTYLGKGAVTARVGYSTGALGLDADTPFELFPKFPYGWGLGGGYSHFWLDYRVKDRTIGAEVNGLTMFVWAPILRFHRFYLLYDFQAGYCQRRFENTEGFSDTTLVTTGLTGRFYLFSMGKKTHFVLTPSVHIGYAGEGEGSTVGDTWFVPFQITAGFEYVLFGRSRKERRAQRKLLAQKALSRKPAAPPSLGCPDRHCTRGYGACLHRCTTLECKVDCQQRRRLCYIDCPSYQRAEKRRLTWEKNHAPPITEKPGTSPATTLQPDRCATSKLCTIFGMCAFVEGRCRAMDDHDCMKSRVCARQGRCGVVEGKCVATSEDDCKQSTGCSLYHKCHLRAGKCTW